MDVNSMLVESVLSRNQSKADSTASGSTNASVTLDSVLDRTRSIHSFPRYGPSRPKAANRPAASSYSPLTTTLGISNRSSMSSTAHALHAKESAADASSAQGSPEN